MGSMGSGTPISPVEHTTTSSAAHPRLSALSSHIRRASRRPGSPVAALAFPELSTTAAARPSRKWSLLTCTGAACTRFVVNTAVAGTGRRSVVATRARSSTASGLMPHAMPPASKPVAAVTLTA